MALDIKVSATLDQASLKKIKEQIQKPLENVKIKFGVHKTALTSAVKDALKGIKDAKLTISKISFSGDAIKQMKEITRFYKEQEAQARKNNVLDDEIFDLRKQTGADRIHAYWEKNKEALRGYGNALRDLEAEYKASETPKQLALVGEKYKNLKIETDKIIASEKERAKVSDSAMKGIIANAEREQKAAQVNVKTQRELTEVEKQLLETRKQTAVNNVSSQMQKNSKSIAKYRTEYEALMVKFQTAETPEQLKRVNAEFAELKSRVKAAGDEGLSFGDRFKRSLEILRGYFSVTAVFNMLRRLFSQAYQDIKNIDTAMTELKKVTDETDASYASFLKRSGASAKELGRTVSGLVQQTAQWAKLGYSLQDAERNAQISSVYANVGDLDDSTAVQDLVSISKAYGIESANLISIVDELNELGNNFATDAASLGDGLSRSASALNVAGNSLEESIAMLTGMSEITQNAAAAGDSLKVISLRLRGKLFMPYYMETYNRIAL